LSRRSRISAGHADDLFEAASKVVFAHLCSLRQRIEAQRLVAVRLGVAADLMNSFDFVHTKTISQRGLASHPELARSRWAQPAALRAPAFRRVV
jgi:hypothetical protein